MSELDKAIRDAANANIQTAETPLPQRCADALARLLASFGIPSNMIEDAE